MENPLETLATLINPAIFYHECEYKPFKLFALAAIKEGKVVDIELTVFKRP